MVGRILGITTMILLLACNVTDAHVTVTIRLSLPKASIVSCEPLNIEMNIRSSNEHQPHLRLFLNGKMIDETVDGKGWKAAILPRYGVNFIKEGEGYVAREFIQIFSLGYGGRDAFAPLVDTAGQYKVKVVDKTSGAESDVVTIDVAKPSNHEEKARKLFVGSNNALQAIVYVGRGEWHDIVRALDKDNDTVVNLEKIIKDLGDTPFAPYASHILGVKKSTEIDMAGKPWGEMTKEIQETIPYFLPALKVEKSRLQEEALFYLRRCYIMLHSGTISTEENEYYNQLIQKYPFGEYAVQAQVDRKRKDERLKNEK